MTRTLELLNQLTKEEFLEELGWIYEHSPWVAEQAYEDKPFSSLEELHATMSLIVAKAPYSQQLKLIKAHPDLAARIEMADASVKEQSAAGLNTLTEAEYEEFYQLNESYKDKFGFPFIIAVKGLDKTKIKDAMKARILFDKEKEHQEAIKQINRIGYYRLVDYLKK